MTEPKVAVCCTLAAYKCMSGRPLAESQSWLTHASAWAEQGHEFFAALQVGHGHDGAFDPLCGRLAELDATVWTFSIDDGADTITSNGRLLGICTGRNMAHEYMNRSPWFTHLLFLDSDVEPPIDGIEKLLEVDWPVVAGRIGTYCMERPKLTYEHVQDDYWKLLGSDHLGPWNTPTTKKRFPDDADVREGWQSAGCWMLQRLAVNRIRWGTDLSAGVTDDPWTADLAVRVGLGPIWQRYDCVATHWPQSIGPLEARGHDLSTR